MIAPARRDGQLVADLAAERWTLCEAQVMGITGRSPAGEAGIVRRANTARRELASALDGLMT